MNKPDTLCLAPWTHTYLSPQTERRMCCASREPAQNFEQYIDTSAGTGKYIPITLEDHWNSDHIFDESYDTLDFFDARLDILHDNIKNFNKEKYLDPLTKQKIKHNYDRFYDRSTVLVGVTNDLIQPIVEWIYGN